MKPGKLNFLEPSGPLQACNGTALHFLNFPLEVFELIHPAVSQRRLTDGTDASLVVEVSFVTEDCKCHFTTFL